MASELEGAMNAASAALATDERYRRRAHLAATAAREALCTLIDIGNPQTWAPRPDLVQEFLARAYELGWKEADDESSVT